MTLLRALVYNFGILAVSLAVAKINVSQTATFYARTIAYTWILLASAFLGMFEGILFGFFGKRGLAQWVTARTHYFLCRWLLGIRFVIEDPHNYLGTTRPAVFIANHQSMFDIAILGATFPKWCSVTAKKALRWYPILGWFMSASKTVFIDRASRTNALKAFESAREEVLRDRQSIFMFPEGTRSNAMKPMLLPFKKGAFHFAQQCGIPVVPYVVCNYSNIFSTKARISRPGIIRIRVLEPVITKDLTAADVGAVTEKVRTEMLATAEDLGYAVPLP